MASSSASGASPSAVSRLKLDYMRLKQDPLPYITAEPLPHNILEWHYCVKGPEDSPYYGGYYHGTLLFPKEFPFQAPSITMLTPNGRFRTNKFLCLNISDFHPDSWNPTWSVGTILTGLLSFMLENTPTMGSMESSDHDKEMFAKKSLAFNLRDTTFCDLFPEIVEEIKQRLPETQAINGVAEEAALDANLADGDGGGVDGGGGGGHQQFDVNALEARVRVWLAQMAHIRRAAPPNRPPNPYAVYFNMVIIVVFAIFAISVSYVIKNMNPK